MTCTLVPLTVGVENDQPLIPGCQSMGRGAARNAVYYSFTVPAGGATNVVIDVIAVSGFSDTYAYLRSGIAANNVGGVDGFGVDPAISSDDDSGGSANSRICSSCGSNSPSFNGILSAGDYTIEASSFNASAAGVIGCTVNFVSSASTERGVSIRRGNGTDLITLLGSNNQYTIENNGNTYGAHYSTRGYGSTDRKNYHQLASGGGGGTTLTTYYKMRGYYVAGSVYETYVVTGSPSSTPPSGHTLINVAIVSTWQQ